MIEIGVYKGDSIPFWRQLAPSWVYIGIDRDTPPRDESFIKCKCMDQSDSAAMDTFVNDTRAAYSVLFINDDGSHVPEHQISTFNKLFPLLEDGGVYFIEDIETSYWTRGELYNTYYIQCGYRHPSSAVEKFKHVLDYVNSDFLHAQNRKALEEVCRGQGFDVEVLKYIRTITFGPNFISIEKKLPAEDDQYSNRPYRLWACL